MRKLLLVLALFWAMGAQAERIEQRVNIMGRQPVVIVNSVDKPRGTVILAHGCSGVTRQSWLFWDWSRMINSWGYNSVIMDSYRVRGYPDGICTQPLSVMPNVRAMDMSDLADWIRSQTWHRGGLGLVGFSAGGSTALAIASIDGVAQRFDAVVAYYPACGPGPGRFYPGMDFSQPLTQGQVHLGLADDWTPARECLPYLDRYETHTYPGATHGWDVNVAERSVAGAGSGLAQGNWVMRYHPQADRDSRSRTRQFLDRHLTK